MIDQDVRADMTTDQAPARSELDGRRRPKAKRAKRAGRSSGPVAAVGRLARRAGGALREVPGVLSDWFYLVYDDALDRPVRAVKVLAAIVAAVAVLAGLCWFQAHRYEQTSQARAAALETGKAATIKLMSYNFRSVDRQIDETKDLLTGSFADQYAELVRTSIAPNTKDKQVIVHSAVSHNSVVSSSPGEVVLLMFVNQQSESKLKPEPILTTSRVRVTLQNEDGKWRVSELTPV